MHLIVIFLVIVFGLIGIKKCNGDDVTVDSGASYPCLSAWDGSLPAAERAVKASLRNPSSYEHVSTEVANLGGGKFAFFMTYRATNGFGAVDTSTYGGQYDGSTCGLK